MIKVSQPTCACAWVISTSRSLFWIEGSIYFSSVTLWTSPSVWTPPTRTPMDHLTLRLPLQSTLYSSSVSLIDSRNLSSPLVHKVTEEDPMEPSLSRLCDHERVAGASLHAGDLLLCQEITDVTLSSSLAPLTLSREIHRLWERERGGDYISCPKPGCDTLSRKSLTMAGGGCLKALGHRMEGEKSVTSSRQYRPVLWQSSPQPRPSLTGHWAAEQQMN